MHLGIFDFYEKWSLVIVSEFPVYCPYSPTGLLKSSVTYPFVSFWNKVHPSLISYGIYKIFLQQNILNLYYLHVRS